MIITMSGKAQNGEVDFVRERVRQLGYDTKLFHGERKKVIHVIGVTDRERLRKCIEPLAGVEQMIPILHPFKLASREFHCEDSVISIQDVAVGGDEVVVIAGPCTVESKDDVLTVAEIIKSAGGKFLRGGAFKPRTSPYSFQGLGERGLEMLAQAREQTGLLIVTEVLSQVDVPLVYRYADLLQIGARNMQNFPLLRAVGRLDKPILLKRGMSATIEEWLMSAEYILAEGNPNVILCERGIRTFETYTRNTLDISAVAVVEHLSHLPVIVDPSHASGDWRYVNALAKAAVASGADGLMIEVHLDPTRAVSDGKQSLKPDVFQSLMKDLKNVAAVTGRRM